MAYEVMSRIIGEMPPERAEKLLLNLPAETLFRTLSRLSTEQLQKEGKDGMSYEVVSRIMGEMPPERTEKLLLNAPASLRQKWHVEAMQKMLSEQLQAKFGPLPQEVVESVQKIESEDELSNLAKRLITASSLAELGLN
jgi:Mg/Co/Ni transporter MgtE